MGAPTYGVVCRELHAARGHLYSMVESLSQRELLWLPPRPDGICVSYHFGHIALVEDMGLAAATGKPMLASAEIQETFGTQNVNNRDAAFPSGAEIIDYMQAVRTLTLGAVALRFRSTRDAAAAVEAAEPFRRIINHEYSHTKYIRRICAEMGKPAVDPPPADLIRTDDQTIAAPQYSIEGW